MAQTTAPKPGGLTVARNGNKIVLTWTPIKDCVDQDVKVYRVKANGKLALLTTADLGKTAKKYTYTINRSNYYPNKDGSDYKPKLAGIAFKLARRQKNKTESKYSEEKTFTIKVPGKPQYILPQMDGANTDTFIYAWERNSDDGDINTTHKMFTHFHWETYVSDEGDDNNWGLADTQKITRIDPSTHDPLINQDSKGNFTNTDPHQIIIVEKQSDIDAKKRRYFRVMSVGPAGYSDYQYSSHHLGGHESVSVPTENTSYIGSDETGTSGTIIINTDIDGKITDLGKGYADDTIQVQYAITPPRVIVTTENNQVKSRLALPEGFDSWATADTFSGTGAPDSYTFKVPAQVTDNNVLFIRINRIHDNITTLGTPTLMNNQRYGDKNSRYIGTLSSPILNSISVDEVHKTINVTVTNTTDIPGSFIAVYQSVGDTEKVIGIITSNQSSGTFPGEWSDDAEPTFGIKCYIGDYSPANRASGVTYYSVDSNILMASNGIIWKSDLISKPPIIKQLTKYDNTTAYISWEWTWAQADSAEITWSTNKMQWESTDDPSRYILTNTRNGWRYVTGLSAGIYYFKVRFIRTYGDTVAYGKYSEIAELKMSEGPTTPALTLSDEDGIVASGDEVTVYWKYQSNDGTPQSFAQLGETQNTEAPWTYTRIETAFTNTDSFIKFTPEELGWMEGTTHRIGVTLMSGSAEPSKDGWSEPISITVARKPEVNITGLTAIQSVNDANEAYTYKLVSLPIRFTVSGFGGDGYCSVAIERASTYNMERPDDTNIVGHEGETVFAATYYPEEDGTSVSVTIDRENLIGHLDESAQYLMTIINTDKYGQKTAPTEYPFTVVWDRHALMPTADIIIDSVNDIARITPISSGPVQQGDYCQIYRMSADKPQLVLDEGTFGTEYVDVYPTYGRFGGYRVVYVTSYGDYKTDQNELAMTEYSKSGNDEDIDQYDKFMVSIQFDDNLVEFPGNISLNHSWAKDFQTTRYLGGSIQGDWNPGVIRSGTINGTIPIEHETDTMYGLRLLADYAGICHVRTPDGSNFYGDIQVRDDREEKWVTRISKISLNYTKVDGEEDQLIPYSEWIANQEE